jgi:transposase InsO family protein
MRPILAFVAALVRAALMSRRDLALENAALRQQLAAYQRGKKRPRLKPSERVLWAVLSRFWSDWKSSLIIVKPKTVIAWHKQGFRLFWRWRSHTGKVGRPRIPSEHIALIKRISRENPGWGEDKVAEELGLKLGVHHAASTIRRYMVRVPDPERGQSWRRFLTNHAHEICACDFLVQYTALFNVVYVFVVMELETRRIALINVTTSPSLAWVKQQIREIAPFGGGPHFLIHDNDGIYGQFRERRRGRPFRCHLDLWLERLMGIKGIPVPYRAPNANAVVERFNRTLREDALNHFIFLNEGHVRRVCREFVEYYNRARPSQATGAIPDPYPELCEPVGEGGEVIALPVLGGVQHDYRRAA